jgi:hypothetical protein
MRCGYIIIVEVKGGKSLIFGGVARFGSNLKSSTVALVASSCKMLSSWREHVWQLEFYSQLFGRFYIAPK